MYSLTAVKWPFLNGLLRHYLLSLLMMAVIQSYRWSRPWELGSRWETNSNSTIHVLHKPVSCEPPMSWHVLGARCCTARATASTTVYVCRISGKPKPYVAVLLYKCMHSIYGTIFEMKSSRAAHRSCLYQISVHQSIIAYRACFFRHANFQRW